VQRVVHGRETRFDFRESLGEAIGLRRGLRGFAVGVRGGALRVVFLAPVRAPCAAPARRLRRCGQRGFGLPRSRTVPRASRPRGCAPLGLGFSCASASISARRCKVCGGGTAVQEHGAVGAAQRVPAFQTSWP